METFKLGDGGRLVRLAIGVAWIGCAGTKSGTEDAREALTSAQQDILGFEKVNLWSSPTGPISTLGNDHTQGAKSLQVAPKGYVTYVSKPLASLGAVGQKLMYDLKLPTQQANANWFGTSQIFVSIPSRNANNVFVGQVELTGLALNTWVPVTFSVPPALATTIGTTTYTDLTFTLVLNVASSETGTYLIDNLRFSAASGGTGGGTGSAGRGGTAGAAGGTAGKGGNAGAAGRGAAGAAGSGVAGAAGSGAAGAAGSGAAGAAGSGAAGSGGACVPTQCAGDLCNRCTDAQCIPATDGCAQILDPNDRQLCENLYACFLDPANACVIQGDSVQCWCGTNLATCNTDNTDPTKANGPCVAQVLAAAKIEGGLYDAATIKQRYVDPSFPLGRAVNLTNCRGTFCSGECGVQ